MTPYHAELQRRVAALEQRSLRAGMAATRACRAMRAAALRLRRGAAEERERRRLDEYLARDHAATVAWRQDPFPASSYPELAADPEARALAIRLRRQIGAEWADR